MVESGIVLYNIEADGCLNGVYTNEWSDGEIFNEIARMKLPNVNNAIVGIYDCVYFDQKNVRENADLRISLIKGKNKTFEFVWEIKGKIVFEGIGYLMNEKQLSVQYWEK